jgi:hypothetical protein
VGARLFIVPELADGRADEVHAWSDVYSLGKLLFWLLNGGRVFDREQHRETDGTCCETTTEMLMSTSIACSTK